MTASDHSSVPHRGECTISKTRHLNPVVIQRSSAYNTGGISGDTLERPALQALLADIGARKVDVVIVYKLR